MLHITEPYNWSYWFDWRITKHRFTSALWLKKPYTRSFHRETLSSKILSIPSIFARHLSKYPAPLGLTLSWTFGSLSFLALIIQIVSGICLTMHYVPSVDLAFDSVEHIMRDVNYGHMIRYIHANGASFYFVCVYCHIFRSLYHRTFLKNILTWQVGVVILLLSMAAAFLGYVLPWGQMSFWGATVITNLFSVIPLAGPDVVTTMWGGFGVGGPTLSRFYTLHFVIPLIIFALVMLHILLLHDAGSSTPQNSGTALDKGTFGGLFILKDTYLISFGLIIFCAFLVFGPNVLNHPDNYNPADPMQTPPHIVPEWYFLPFYAVLRAIPNKAAGVIAMALSILFFFFLPAFGNKQIFGIKDTNKFQMYEKILFWGFTLNALILGYLGGMPIEWPYNLLSLLCFILYFVLGWYLSARSSFAQLVNQTDNHISILDTLEKKKSYFDEVGGIADLEELTLRQQESWVLHVKTSDAYSASLLTPDTHAAGIHEELGYGWSMCAEFPGYFHDRTPIELWEEKFPEEHFYIEDVEIDEDLYSFDEYYMWPRDYSLEYDYDYNYGYNTEYEEDNSGEIFTCMDTRTDVGGYDISVDLIDNESRS